MIGITLTADQIRNAPREVRQWIEHEVMAGLGIAAAQPPAPPPQVAHLVGCSVEEAQAILTRIEGVLPAINVFFELGRPVVSYGQPPVMVFRLLDIMHHTRLQNVGQVMACLQLISQALADVRRDASVRFCDFDEAGHCLLPPQTQQSIATLWQNMAASHQAAEEADVVPAA
jgi:hypothetical protein